MSSADSKSYEVTWMIRRLFRAMGQEADRYLASSGLSAADRAVLEFLYPAKLLTVPEIASRYQVSRQHVQVTVNPLLEQGLLSQKPNPRHRRSPLFCLTPRGKKLFSQIHKNEQAIVDRLFQKVSVADLDATHRTLEHLLEGLYESRSSRSTTEVKNEIQ